MNVLRQPKVTLLARPQFIEPEHLPVQWKGESTDGEKLAEFAKQYQEKKAFERPAKGKDIIDTGVTVVGPQDVAKFRAKPAAGPKKPKPGKEEE